MDKILITYSTNENYEYFFKLLTNAEKFGYGFYYLHLEIESQKKCIRKKLPKIYEYVEEKALKKASLSNIKDAKKKVRNLIINLYLFFNKHNPNKVCIFGGKQNLFNSILYEISKIKKIEIFFSENTPIPGTFYISKYPGYEFLELVKDIQNNNNFNQIEKEKLMERGKKLFFEIKKRLPKRHHYSISSWINFQTKLGLKNLINKKRKILILGVDSICHGLFPKNNNYRKYTFPIYKSFGEMVNDVAEFDNIEIWVKLHPADKLIKEYYDNLKKSNKITIFQNIDPNILINNCDIVIACLSKLEINVMALSKPLIYPGKGWFYGQKYTDGCNNKSEFLNLIKKLINNPEIELNYKNILILLGWYEKTFVNLYDYISNKDESSNINQIKKFLKLLNLSINEKNKNDYITVNSSNNNYIEMNGIKYNYLSFYQRVRKLIHFKLLYIMQNMFYKK